MKKKAFYHFINQNWFDIEIMIQKNDFVIVTEDNHWTLLNQYFFLQVLWEAESHTGEPFGPDKTD